jgi:hypothetical protein
MTFGNREDSSDSIDSDALMVEDTTLLERAAVTADTSQPKLVTMATRMTDGKEIEDSTTKAGLSSITQLTPDDARSRRQYDSTIKWIEETNGIQECRAMLEQHRSFKSKSMQDMRVAICAQLHDKPSIPHPPRRSIYEFKAILCCCYAFMCR